MTGRRETRVVDLPCPLGVMRDIGYARCVRLDLGRILEEAAKSLHVGHGLPKVRLMLSVGRVALEEHCRQRLAATAILMVSGALARLRGIERPELLVVLFESPGEIRLSTIDNSAEDLSGNEVRRIKEVSLPLGGIHDWERSALLTESTVSFLVKPEHGLGWVGQRLRSGDQAAACLAAARIGDPPPLSQPVV